MKNEIIDGMARAFFACAWADQCEEAGQESMLSGREIMDIMPDEIDPAAIHAARTLAMDFIRAQPYLMKWGGDLDLLNRTFVSAKLLDRTGADRELTPELFGHYLAMQAMGTGVGLESFGYAVRDFFKVPYVEFGGYSLEKDYF